jgi:NAD(P)-dependent dehydrogenase (short-subunit alcohol dehydrogenase family)
MSYSTPRPPGSGDEPRVAIVTGGASGIGRASAELFAANSHRLVIVDQNEEALSELLMTLDQSRCVTLPGDVTVQETAQRAVATGLERFGRIDVLVNNAGTAFVGSVVETEPQQWATVLAVNLTSVYYFCRAAIPAMTPGSAIVNVASEAGLVGFERYVAYGAAKAAVVALTRCMALDHARDGIRVNCVCPGSIETPLLRRYFEAQPDPEAARQADERAHPLGIGDPRDSAEAIFFLASERARYITGHPLAVDGGFTAG